MFRKAPRYRETCVALGFLDDDNEWDLVMTESAAYVMPSQIRATFAILLVFNEVGHTAGLFDKHRREMGEDFVHRLSSEEHPLSDTHLMILVLVDINMRLEARNTHLKALNLPIPKEEEMREVKSRAFFISSSGGTGNTYLLNTLLDAVRSNWGHE
jgi:hypothetical protein